MNQKTLTWISIIVFSTIFGMIPFLWGENIFSFSGIIFNAIGGIFGIWFAYKIKNFI